MPLDLALLALDDALADIGLGLTPSGLATIDLAGEVLANADAGLSVVEGSRFL